MKIAILGAGGMRLPLLYAALIERADALGLDALALMDIDADRLALMFAVARAQGGATPASLQVLPTVDLDQALDGATFVITTRGRHAGRG
jgi:6-phospho-beta-glucosidase